jgi:hypothetical protein
MYMRFNRTIYHNSLEIVLYPPTEWWRFIRIIYTHITYVPH